MDKNFYNDGIWKCNDCEIIFKVYVKENLPEVSFCPDCGSRDIDEFDEEE